jgi:hypothetical protein
LPVRQLLQHRHHFNRGWQGNLFHQDSDGNTSSTKSVSFSGAGTKEVEAHWQIADTGSYWVKVYIDTPNHQTFGPFKFDVTCP